MSHAPVIGPRSMSARQPCPRQYMSEISKIVRYLPQRMSETSAPRIGKKYAAALKRWYHCLACSSLMKAGWPAESSRCLVMKTVRMVFIP